MKRAIRQTLSILLVASIFGGTPASGQQAGRVPLDPEAKFRLYLMKQLPGNEEMHYGIAMIGTRTDVNIGTGILQMAALFGEMVIAPATIIAAIQGDRNLRPGMILEKAPKTPPAKQFHDVDLVVIRGKKVPSTGNHWQYMAKGPVDGKVPTWTLVGRGTDRNGVNKATAQAEVNMKKAAMRGANITVTRVADAP